MKLEFNIVLNIGKMSGPAELNEDGFFQENRKDMRRKKSPPVSRGAW